MTKVFEDIKQGLSEAIEYENSDSEAGRSKKYKLYHALIMGDVSQVTVLVIARNEEEAVNKINKKEYPNNIHVIVHNVFELKEINGHKIIV